MSFHKRRCVAKGCNSSSSTHHFFRFPKDRTPSERLRYSKWAEFAQNPKVTGVVNTHAYLCALHFARNQFRDDNREKLIHKAIPTIPAKSNSPVTSDDSGQPFEDVWMLSSEDDDVQPQVQVLYPDSALEQYSENCAFVEQSGGGISNQNCDSDSFVQNINSSAEAISISGAGGENDELVGCKSYSVVTPRKKMQSKLQSEKKLSSRVIKGRFEMRERNGKNLIGLNNGSDLLVQQLAKSMPLASAEFLALQLQLGKKQRRSRKWTPAEKMLAMVVYKRWPECYMLLANMFVLPRKKILLKMLAKVTLLPGLNHHMFKSLAQAVADMDAIDRTCILLFDEAPIREHLEYNHKTDTIVGFENLGDMEDESETPKIGNRTLVFMVKGLAKKWKQPIAFYFSRGALGSKTVAKLLCRLLQTCRKAGLNVVGTVCNMCKRNIKMLKHMGVSANRPYFYFEKQRFVTLYDAPHLLRVVRNILLKHDIFVKLNSKSETVDSKASWSIVRAVYDIDQLEPKAHRRLHKLTDSHIAPEGHAKVDVAVAAQVMSNAMATAISDQVHNGFLEYSALGTAYLVGFCNKLFDSLNSTSLELLGADGLPCQLQKGREDVLLNFWEESVKELKQWKIEVSTSIKGSEDVKYSPLPCEVGWVTTLQGMKLLWQTLKEQGFKCIEPGSINLDTLADLFKSVRSSCVSGTKPTVIHFVSVLKTLLLDSLAFVDVRQLNCAEECDVDDQSSSLLELMTCCSSALHREVVLTETASGHHSGGTLCLSCVSCDVTKRLLLNLDCDSCERALCAATQDPRLHCGIVFKEYTETVNGLTYPSAELIECVSSAADVVVQVLPHIAHRKRVQATTLQEMKETVNFEWLQQACPEHADIVCNDILTFVCHVTIQQWCRNKHEALLNVA